ncbi:hypothetical protein PN499_04270 [Kamptonema animale CS-326]|uniref:hypothetical protein n=1 Tax=Kamptonema animale TaxID=92934 RepID=UPI00232F6C4B|nr:hypothetical protein [Kamptonema animale]MDB9510394.1 hypothetical protein [Kamptonema animale CS-326]
MTSKILQLEGTWEEILTHTSELAGHRVRVTVISDSEPLKSAEKCFRQGWYEAMTGQTIPLSELWEGIDAEISDSEPIPSPEESFRQAWQEIKTGKTRPVSELWDGIDAE